MSTAYLDEAIYARYLATLLENADPLNDEWRQSRKECVRKLLELLKQETIPVPEKPPLGLQPLWSHREERLREIILAMGRYMNAHKQLPKEWVVEFNELVMFLKETQP